MARHVDIGYCAGTDKGTDSGIRVLPDNRGGRVKKPRFMDEWDERSEV